MTDSPISPYPPVSPTHDTTALPRDGAEQGVWEQVRAWESRYARERRRTRILLVTTVLAVVAATGLGLAAFGMYRPSTTASSSVDGSATSQAATPAPTGTGQNGSSDGATGAQTPAPAPTGQDGSSGGPTSPQLPEPLRRLGSALGITNVDDLIDLAVSNHLLTADQAAALRAAITAATAAASTTDPGTSGTAA